MCLIYYRDPTVHSAKPDREILERGRTRNADGAGLLFWNGEQWQRQRRAQLTARELTNWLDYCEDRNYRFAVHFRYSTGGLKDKNNCHPFDLGLGFYLMHNGTLTIKPDAIRSDTAILAATIRRAKLADRIDDIAPLIEGVRNGSRLLVAQPCGACLFAGEWHEEESGKFSNKNCHWAPAATTYQRISYVPQYDTRPAQPGAGIAAPAPDWRYSSNVCAWVAPGGQCYRWQAYANGYVLVPQITARYPDRSDLTTSADLPAPPRYAPLSQLGQGARAGETDDLTDQLRDLLDNPPPRARDYRRPYDWE
jgi:hypothetical protein